MPAQRLKNKIFAKICAQKSAGVEYGNPPYLRTLTNHNKLLRMYEGTVGVKTGFTKKSGRCLVSAVERQGMTFIAVTLNDPDDWNSHMKLYDYAFDTMKNTVLENAPQGLAVKVVGSEKSEVALKYAVLPSAPLKSDEARKVRCEILLEPFVYAPVTAEQILGKAVFYLDDYTVCEAPLVAQESANIIRTDNQPKKQGFLDKIFSFLKIGGRNGYNPTSKIYCGMRSSFQT